MSRCDRWLYRRLQSRGKRDKIYPPIFPDGKAHRLVNASESGKGGVITRPAAKVRLERAERKQSHAGSASFLKFPVDFKSTGNFRFAERKGMRRLRAIIPPAGPRGSGRQRGRRGGQQFCPPGTPQRGPCRLPGRRNFAPCGE